MLQQLNFSNVFTTIPNVVETLLQPDSVSWDGVRYPTISGIASRFFIMTKNRQDVVY